jgi:hypothetical protein
MRSELKALALIGLLAVGTAEPAAAIAYRFDMRFGWAIGGYPYYCDGPCRTRFIADTGITVDGGVASGTWVVDETKAGTFSMTLGNWSQTFRARMFFLDPWPGVADTVIQGEPQSDWGFGRFTLCGPAISPAKTVQGVASQASAFFSCAPYTGGGLDAYLFGLGHWAINMGAGSFRYVPEPGTLGLLSLGLLGLGFTARRRLH